MLRLFYLFFLISFFHSASGAGQINPWYFDLGCESFKIFRDKSNDHVDLFKYNPNMKNYEWFQGLSNYAQKFDYHMEGPELHFISVTDESGHMVVYKWREGEFYVWG